MSESTLAVFSNPEFPQILAAAIDYAVDRILAHPQLGSCEVENESRGCHSEASRG